MDEKVGIQDQLGIVVCHTHWDREWRAPIWTNRFHLMQFMDSLLKLLADDESYVNFVLDGQTVIVQDYLEMAPENIDKLADFITHGRISIGPWYTLPDLYPVAGESLIRNLSKGLSICEQYGARPTVAYTTFGWGQSAQMPQIYAGFGLDFIITAKHISPARMPDIEFLWKAPDGTKLLTSRLGDDARANFYFNTYIPVRYGITYKGTEYVYNWGSTVVSKSADPQRSDEDYQTIKGKGSYHPEMLPDGVRTTWDGYGATKISDVRLLLNGSDSTFPQELLPRIIADVNAMDSIDFKLIHGTLENYANLVRQRVKSDQLHIVEGELRDGPAASVTGNALAVRIPNKQLNARIERMLTSIAEPLLVYAGIVGGNVGHSATFLEKAWEYLFKSHCHDSINGVGQDKTASDTRYRLMQAQEITEALTDAGIREILQRIDCSAFMPEDVLLFVYNPLPYPRASTIEISLDIPRSTNPWTISLVDSLKMHHAIQILSREERLAAVDDSDARPWTYDCERIRGLVTIDHLPASGWEVFSVHVDEQFSRNRIWPPARVVEERCIAKTSTIMENKFLCVVVNGNGTITIVDKMNKRTYHDLLSLEDAGDVGDYWVYSPPYGDRIISSKGCAASISLISNGPEQASVSIELDLRIPKEAKILHQGLTNEGVRSADTTVMKVCHTVSLRKTERFVRVRTRMENNAKDHRVRIQFPLGFRGTTSASMSHFFMDERSTDPNPIPSRETAYWPEMQTYPMRQCVDVGDGKAGLSVFTESFTEYEVENSSGESILSLSAFRAVHNKICTEYRTYTYHEQQMGGQLLESLEFSYAIHPHAGDWESAHVVKLAETFLTEPLAYQFSACSSGYLSPKHSAGSIDNDHIHISALKTSRDGLGIVIRVWNSSKQPQNCTFAMEHPIHEALYVSMDERQVLGIVESHDRWIQLKLDPHKIVTIYLK